MKVEVVSYNVLSSAFALASEYTQEYTAATFDPEKRYSLLWNKLQTHTEALICLQEVDTDLSCRLHVDFCKANYEFIFHPYGIDFVFKI